MAEEKKKPTLTEEVGRKYRTKKVEPGIVHFKGQNYDLTKISLSTAEKLVKEECPYLELIPSDKTAEKSGNTAVNAK